MNVHVVVTRLLAALSLFLVASQAPALAPTPPRIPDQSATEGQSFQFTAPTFTDPEGDPLTYTFSGLPDWLKVAYPAQNPRYIAGRPSYSVSTANAPRRYAITLIATDPGGLSASATFQLTVGNVNDPPVPPDRIAAPPATEGTGYQYTAPQFSDPDGDPLTYSFSGLPPWLKVCYPASNPRYLCGKPPHSESSASVERVYEITVMARDTLGNTASKAFSLSVTNVNAVPVAPTSISAPPATEGRKYSYTVPQFLDADGDELTYSFEGLPSWLMRPYPSNPRYLATTLTHGFPPYTESTASVEKVYTINVTATDPHGHSASKSFALKVLDVNAPPQPPPAIPTQIATENIGFGYTIPPFKDVDGDTIRYSFAGLPYWLAVAYPDVNPRYLAGKPPYSESSHASDKAYRIDVVANDGNGGTATTSFFLIVANVNRPPTPPSPATIYAFEGKDLVYVMPAFSDADGDRITYSAVELPAWLQFNSVTRTLTGTPPNTDLPNRGTTNYPVQIRATDSSGASATASGSVVASPPTKYRLIASGTLLGLSPDGAWVTYVDGSGRVYRRNVNDGQVQSHDIAGWRRIDLAPDGRFLAYAVFDGVLAGQCEIASSGMTCASIYVLDLQTGTKVQAPIGGWDDPIVTVSDGGELVAARHSGAYHRPTGQTRSIGTAIHEMQASGSGGRIAISNFSSARLYDWPSNSTTSFDDGAGGTTTFRNVSISQDGALTALESNRTLVTGTTPGRFHTYLRDNNSRTYTLVSADDSGQEANAPSTAAGISPDGRFVAFYSQASNLSSGPIADIFVKDVANGFVTPIYGCNAPRLSALPTRLACQAPEGIWLVDPIVW